MSLKSFLQKFQLDIQYWADTAFGKETSSDLFERKYRFLEEVLELVQTVELPDENAEEECIRLVRYVFSRPKGEPFQEAGGVMVTFALLCNSLKIDAQDAAVVEEQRVWDKIEIIRAKQALKPKRSSLPGPTISE